MASAFWFIVLIGILIFAHEAGHFLFAKLFKVKVLTFSLGFGGPVRIGRFKLSWKPGETEYRVAWFPAGGFVRMMGDDPSEEIAPADRDRAFLTQRPWKRFLIIFGGPMFSILLAVPIYFVYHLVQGTAAGPDVGMVISGSPAAQAGIQAGDTILSISSRPTSTWEEVDEALQATGGTTKAIQVKRGDRELSFEVNPIEELDETGLQLMGERWDVGVRHHRQGNLIGVVGPDSPAFRAGVRSWDKILEVAGIGINGWADVDRLIAANGQNLLAVKLVRASEIHIGAVTIRAPIVVEAVLNPEPAERAPAGAMVSGSVYSGIEPIDMYVMGLVDDFPAQQAGIRAGDKIVSMLGKPVHSWEQFSRIVIDHADDDIPLEVRQGSSLSALSVKPRILSETNEFKQTTRKPGMGVTYQQNILSGQRIERPDRLAYATRMAVVQTGRAISMNVLGFVRIFQGRVKATEAIGGPIMILDVAGKSAEKGWGTFVSMMAFLSVLLGMLNLLPVPILDGGHIAFIVIEAVRRKPVSLATRVVASYIGLFLLVSLMAFAFYNDITRYWSDIASIFG